MIKATIDTNVIISGLVFGGIPSKVLQLALERRFEMVLSPPLIVEVERVLFSKKFGLTTQEGRELLQPMVDISTIIVPKTVVDVVRRCPGDNHVLACAKDGRCDHIVTGDRRDLLALGEFEGISIVSPRSFWGLFQ